MRQPSRENVQHQTRGDNEKLGNPKKLFYDDPATANSKTMSPKLSTTTYSDLLPEVETEKLVNRMLEVAIYVVFRSLVFNCCFITIYDTADCKQRERERVVTERGRRSENIKC